MDVKYERRNKEHQSVSQCIVNLPDWHSENFQSEHSQLSNKPKEF